MSTTDNPRTDPDRQACVCECGEHGFVRLTRGLVAFFSPRALPLVAPHRWTFLRAKTTTYARSIIDGYTTPMHRLVLGAQPRRQLGARPEFDVDHIDHDGLNNRDGNLRKCTHAENIKNQRAHRGTISRMKGVQPARTGSGWYARITSDGKSTHLGTFATAEEAARAYDHAALELHGEFAATNASLGLLSEVAA